MANTVDLIKNIIVRLEMNKRSRKNRKIETQLITELHNKFHSIFVQEDDNKFFEEFEKLIVVLVYNYEHEMLNSLYL